MRENDVGNWMFISLLQRIECNLLNDTIVWDENEKGTTLEILFVFMLSMNFMLIPKCPKTWMTRLFTCKCWSIHQCGILCIRLCNTTEICMSIFPHDVPWLNYNHDHSTSTSNFPLRLNYDYIDGQLYHEYQRLDHVRKMLANVDSKIEYFQVISR